MTGEKGAFLDPVPHVLPLVYVKKVQHGDRLE